LSVCREDSQLKEAVSKSMARSSRIFDVQFLSTIQNLCYNFSQSPDRSRVPLGGELAKRGNEAPETFRAQPKDAI
jgi:hypothetical protein